ncbi:MTH1187 family thiamine-binding protein [Acidianus sulfidivorans JP7]|uniref:Thiamine-binding protein domain-containing protein n=1 Tax=Acidianus sulfidivorans JP7 TaxID=619593 RepID=A0A2U9IKH0_9CREN|nr:MTH1187 family thiamine-binding protein [Acidianus sulfidivorans]AWR96528.1 MTH1187 family thiamine-binding protein [Acidianus sulfidivorans JP7]
MKYLVDISVEPIGTNSTSLSKYVRLVYEVLKSKNIKFYPAPSMTTLELDDITQLGYIIKDIDDALAKEGIKRIVSILKIDDRRDKENSIDHKLEVIKM